LKARGVELRFIMNGSDAAAPSRPDPVLMKTIVKAHGWWMRLLTGNESLTDIARAEGVTDRYVRSFIDLAFLAPDVVSGILEGQQPAHLSSEALTRLPIGWHDQKTKLLD
jgi:hypothetical protein